MTNAPTNLLSVRKLLLTHLDIDPSRARSIDLESAEVGIVGDPAHIGGYHCGSDRVRRVGGEIRDYSVVESSRDRAGLTLAAAALDVGLFTATTPKGTYDLAHFSAWCVAQCTAGAADTRDIREIIWSPDGRAVRRWDALGRRSTGDDSHRWHTHFSFFRDAIKAGRDLTPLFRRYLIHIGLIKGDPFMALSDAEQDELLTLARSTRHIANVAGYRVAALTGNRLTYDDQMDDKTAPNRLAAELADAKLRQEAILRAVTGGDREQVLAAIAAQGEQTRAELTALAAEDAQRDAELADLFRAGQSGELAAEEVLRRLGELLTTGTTPAQG